MLITEKTREARQKNLLNELIMALYLKVRERQKENVGSNISTYQRVVVEYINLQAKTNMVKK